MIPIKMCDRFENEEQENEDISYICSFTIRHYWIELWLSDYSQSYFIKYKNNIDNEIKECGLGTYNFSPFEATLELLDPKGYYYSNGWEDSWNERMEDIKSKGLPSIDYDDYGIYDIEGFYKEHEK